MATLLLIISSALLGLSAVATEMPANTVSGSGSTQTIAVDPQVAPPPPSPFIYPPNNTNGNNVNGNNINGNNTNALSPAQNMQGGQGTQNIPPNANLNQLQNPIQANGQPILTDPLLNPSADPNTLASQMQPSANALSQANQQLLSRNAQLQRDVNDLQTQVNVLVKERSGQLFMYGALTVVVSLFIGFFMGWFVFGRRDRW